MITPSIKSGGSWLMPILSRVFTEGGDLLYQFLLLLNASFLLFAGRAFQTG